MAAAPKLSDVLKPTDPKARVDARPQPSPLYAKLFDRGKKGPFKLKLNDDEQKQLVDKVIRDVEDTESSIGPFKRNIVQLHKNWRGTLSKKSFPFPDASNIHVPLTGPQVEQMTSRLLKALFGEGELISKITNMQKVLDPETIEHASDWFHYELIEIVKIRKVLERVIHQILLCGISLPICSYEHEEKELHSVRRFPLPQSSETTDPQSLGGPPPSGASEQSQLGQAQAPTNGPPTQPEQLQTIEESIDQHNREIVEEGSVWSADAVVDIIDDNGEGVFKLSDGGRIEWSIRADMGGPPMLVADVWRNETVFDGVRIKLTRLQDLAVINSSDSIESIPFFATREWLSQHDYSRGLASKYWIDHGKARNEEIAGSGDIKIGEMLPRYEDEQEDRETGTDSVDASAYTPDRRWIECYRWEGYYQRRNLSRGTSEGHILDDSLHVAVWVAVKSRALLRIELLEDLNKDAKRSPVCFKFIDEEGRLFGIGLAEWIRHCQTELDAIHNQRLDAGLLTNMPYFFYEPAAGFRKDIIRIRPGEGYPVKNAQGVVFPKSNWNPAVSFAEEGLSKQYAGEQGGITDAAMGIQPKKRQSATEAQAAAAALDLRTERIVANLLDSLRELFYRILGLYQQFGPRKRIYRIAGEDGTTVIKQFERDRLQGRIHLELAGNLTRTNDQLERQLDTDMLSLLLNQLLIELGIVGPDTIYAAIKAVAKSMHSTLPLHKPDMPPASDDPQTENKQLFEGFPCKGPTINENFSEHLAVHMKLASDSDVVGAWSNEQRARLADHIAKTTELQQQAAILKQLMAAQAVQMQMSMNSMGINPGQAGNQQPGAGAGRSASPAEKAGGAQGGPTSAPSNSLGGVSAAA